MSGYTKLFNSILASTVWREPMETRIVWITLLAMADRNGIAEGSVPGLADFARIPVDATREALARLSAPDEDSRSQEFDGRRIEAIDGGWRLLNHAKYRAKMGADERREYNRVRQARYRNNVSQMSQNVIDNNASRDKAEAEAEAQEIKIAPPARLSVSDEIAEKAGLFLERYPVIYAEERRGATFRLKPVLHFQTACEIVQGWPDAERLELMFRTFCQLPASEKMAWPGTPAQFLFLAPTIDARLREVGV